MRALLPVLMLALAPLAAADEGTAECEDDQEWIGYQRTRAAREAVDAATQPHGATAEACEGEQWDGQDATGAPLVALGLGDDPNAAPGDDLLAPVGARLSARGSDDALETYAAANVVFVGRVAVYAGACSGGSGLEGETSCRSGHEGRAGVYARDNTPQNVLSRLVGPCAFSPIPECGMHAERDCDQATYEDAVYTGDRTICGRDNTAFGAMVLLP